MVLWLDLFCGQGGVAAGIARAGGVVGLGVDIVPQPRYPYPFRCDDAIDYLKRVLARTVQPYGAVWASPPCQLYSKAHGFRGEQHRQQHPDLVGPVRELLQASGLPYVIENVPGAPLHDPVQVCGTSPGVALAHDGFELRRERWFESNLPLSGGDCDHRLPAAPVFGHNAPGNFYKRYGRGYSADARRELMGMPWASRDGISEAIPPAMAAYIVRQVHQMIESRAA